METPKRTGTRVPPTDRKPEITIDDRGDASAPEALDKIRSILFGEESRKNTLRFQQMIELIESRVADVMRVLDGGLSDISTRIDSERQATDDAFDRSAAQQAEAGANIHRLLADIDSRTSNRMSATEARISEVARNADESLQNAAETLRQDTGQQLEYLKMYIDEAVTQLASNKTDRETLAEWFEEMSSRLRS